VVWLVKSERSNFIELRLSELLRRSNRDVLAQLERDELVAAIDFNSRLTPSALTFSPTAGC